MGINAIPFNWGTPHLFGFKIPRVHHSHVSPDGGSFDFQGQLIKQNWHIFFSASHFQVFPCFDVLYVYRFLETYLICLNNIYIRIYVYIYTFVYLFIYLMKYFDIVRKPTHQTPLPPWAGPRRLQPECGSRARELLNKPSHYHLTPFVAGCSVVPWQGADTVCIAYIISCISSSGICWMQNGICSVKTDIGILHRRFDDLLEGVFGSLWNKILLGEGQLQIHIYIFINDI